MNIILNSLREWMEMVEGEAIKYEMKELH